MVKPVESRPPPPYKPPTAAPVKLFNRWSVEGIVVKDPGLRAYISLRPLIVPRTKGRHAARMFYKSRLNIVERLMNHLFVPGHRGKKHLLSSGRCAGKSITAWKIMLKTLELLAQRTKKNPIEVLVQAIENAALREEITSFQLGGIIVRRAVITAPQRRVDMALRLITQGAYKKAVGKRKAMADTLADEILAAYKYDAAASHAIREKERLEREAAGAR
jgi:small subunit ribosomal protein S7